MTLIAKEKKKKSKPYWKIRKFVISRNEIILAGVFIILIKIIDIISVYRNKDSLNLEEKKWKINSVCTE